MDLALFILLLEPSAVEIDSIAAVAELAVSTFSSCTAIAALFSVIFVLAALMVAVRSAWEGVVPITVDPDAVVGTGGCVIGTEGCVVGTGDCVIGTGDCVVGTGGCVVRTGRCVVGTGGCVVGTGGCVVGTGGCVIGTGGCVMEIEFVGAADVTREGIGVVGRGSHWSSGIPPTATSLKQYSSSSSPSRKYTHPSRQFSSLSLNNEKVQLNMVFGL